MTATEAWATAIADRIADEVAEAADIRAVASFLARTLSWLAVKYPAAVEAALDYAHQERAS